MARNFNRDKRRIEELKKKRREEKQQRKLNRASAGALPPAPENEPDPLMPPDGADGSAETAA